MTLILDGTHFTMQFELYIQNTRTNTTIDSYAVSPQIGLDAFLKLINKYSVEKVVFNGKIGIFKEIEQYYIKNNSEVEIIWL